MALATVAEASGPAGSPFFDKLARELRDQIYEYAHGYGDDDYRRCLISKMMLSYYHNIGHGKFLVNKQYYAEAFPMRIRQTEFYIWGSGDFQTCLPTFYGHEMLRDNLTNLEIDTKSILPYEEYEYRRIPGLAALLGPRLLHIKVEAYYGHLRSQKAYWLEFVETLKLVRGLRSFTLLASGNHLWLKDIKDGKLLAEELRAYVMRPRE